MKTTQETLLGAREFAISRLPTPRSFISSVDSESLQEKAQNAPVGSFRGQFRGRSWVRAAPGPNA
eukprot:15450611-Alexandrium_andersonii.AAC.1